MSTKKRPNYIRLAIYAIVVGTAILALLVVGNIAYIKVANLITKNKQIPQNIVNNQKLILIENRLALSEYAKLDAKDPLFYESKIIILEKMKNTIDQGKPGIRNSTLLIKDKSKKEFVQAVTQILETQRNIIDTTVEFDLIVKNIYLFNPSQDLSSENKELYIENIAAASEGLLKIKNNLLTKYGEEKIKLLTDEIDGLINALKTEKSEKIKELFYRLKDSTFKYEKQMLFNEEMIKIIVDQTNMLIEYE